MSIQFIKHASTDTVGVIVVESVSANQKLDGWAMDQDGDIQLVAQQEVPLGHKIALEDIPAGAPVIKYGHDVGEATAEIPKGHHVHVHNIKTKRW